MTKTTMLPANLMVAIAVGTMLIPPGVKLVNVWNHRQLPLRNPQMEPMEPVVLEAVLTAGLVITSVMT